MRQGRPEKSLLITGLRGVGKTVLLSTFRDLAESAGFKTAETEVTHETSFKQMMARLGRRVLLELNPVEKVKDKALQAARVFKAFTLKLPGGYEIGLDIDAFRGKADSGNLSEDPSDLFFALGEAAREKKAGVVFLFDEIQFLERGDMEALIAALHYVTQRSLPVTVVGAGSWQARRNHTPRGCSTSRRSIACRTRRPGTLSLGRQKSRGSITRAMPRPES